MKHIVVSIIGFLLLVSYQNCADVSQISADGINDSSIINGGTNSGSSLTCMALATPYIELNFDFTASDQTAGLIPTNLDIEINGELVHSTCKELPLGYVVAHREGSNLLIRQDYADKDLVNNLQIKLYQRDSCDSASSEELLRANEFPIYKTYEVCATTSEYWDMTYLVN